MSDDVLERWQTLKEAEPAPTLAQLEAAGDALRDELIWTRFGRGAYREGTKELEGYVQRLRAECEALDREVTAFEEQLADREAECEALRPDAALGRLVRRMHVNHVLACYQHGYCYLPECPEASVCPHTPDAVGCGSLPEDALAALGEEDADAR